MKDAEAESREGHGSTPVAIAHASAGELLATSTIIVYSLPSLAVGYTFSLCGLYLLKYSTDVLLVSPVVMGVLFGLSRIWDAISDPIAGYLSDRTRSRLGRRRSWLLASAPLISVAFFMLWNPPAALDGLRLGVWMGVAVFMYYTATTIFNVPQESLGAELSQNHHDRTRVYGIKHLISITGTFLGLGGIALLSRSETPRDEAMLQAVLAGAVICTVVPFAVSRLRERPEYQGRGGTSVQTALGDVWRNPHARLLLLVFAIENFGAASFSVLITYVAQYVLGMPERTAILLAIFVIPAIVFVPLWILLSRRFGKKRLWLFAMSALAFAFFGMFFVGEGDFVLLATLGAIAGVGGGCGQVVGPSIQADIIDWDEHRTGQRKEGVYFAVWNFVRKSSYGISAMITGLVLGGVGFLPNVPQSETVQLAMRTLLGPVPGTCYAVGALLFARFSFNELEHARIRTELDANRDRG